MPFLAVRGLSSADGGYVDAVARAEGGRRPRLVHGRIRAAARSRPDAVAVADAHGGLTFSTLDALANGLAHRLRAAGVGPGVPVGLCHDRSAIGVVGALAVLKAGGAYVGLDPSHPVARLEHTLDHVGAPVLLAQGTVRAALRPGPRLVVDLDAEPIDARDEPPDDLVGEADVAYVIYTSGSTGAPKGVAVSHANLLSLIDWHCRVFAVDASDRASLVASPAFDASVWETWPALCAGASLHVPRPEIVTAPARLREWLVATRITIAFVPTPLAELLLAADWPDGGALRFMLTGGDVLHHGPPASTPFTLVNNYGVAEATVVSTSGVVAPAEAGTAQSARPGIGRPIDGTHLAVLGPDGRPVPAGEPGELCIGGAGVAIGYVGRPELTAECFVRDPSVSGDAGARMYRTGDLARVTPEGEYEFLGRADEQVQVRGQRVELEEIAAALREHATVAGGVVVARERVPGDVQLVAYVVPARDHTVDRTELRAHLASRLPPYMVPTVFVAIDGLPFTTNGKIDRAALPCPDRVVRPEDRGRTAVERAVGALLEELLELDAVGRSDNFFELGGHSLMAAQLVARLEEQFDIEVELLAVFDNPTAAGIAAVLERDAGALQLAAE